MNCLVVPLLGYLRYLVPFNVGAVVAFVGAVGRVVWVAGCGGVCLQRSFTDALILSFVCWSWCVPLWLWLKCSLWVAVNCLLYIVDCRFIINRGVGLLFSSVCSYLVKKFCFGRLTKGIIKGVNKVEI